MDSLPRPRFSPVFHLPIFLLGLIALVATTPARDVPFGSAQVIVEGPDVASPHHVADIDGDGDLDVLFSSGTLMDMSVSWCENLDGEGSFGPPQVIVGSIARTQFIGTADLDGDGDLDVAVTAAFEGVRVLWLENLDGEGTFGAPNAIDVGEGGAYALALVDLDRDGDIDVIATTPSDGGDYGIAWWENADAAGTFGPRHVVLGSENIISWISAADIDRDGDLDLLSSAFTSTGISWHENLDGAGSFASPEIISDLAVGTRSAQAVDVDRDGDLDVVSVSEFDDTVAWHENLDGLGTFGDRQVIDGAARAPFTLSLADLDQDGDIDALTAEVNGDTLSWYENTGATLTGAIKHEIDSGIDYPIFASVADLDGDGDLDAIATQLAGRVVWYENETIHRSAVFGEEVLVPWGEAVSDAVPADIDGDGDLDVLISNSDDDRIQWYENTDGAGTFGYAQTMAYGIIGPDVVVAVDIDGDGDLDAVSSSEGEIFGTGRLLWHENIDGAGTLGSPLTILEGYRQGCPIQSADLNGDGNCDILMGGAGGRTGVQWVENGGGGQTWNLHGPLVESEEAIGIATADFDGDEDLDILVAFPTVDTVAWYENMDSRGSFGPRRVITASVDEVSSAIAADLDGDGDEDVIASSPNSVQTATSWYENTDGHGAFGPPQSVDTWSARSLAAADLDGDLDLDLLFASDGQIVSWCENIDGEGGFGHRQIFAYVVRASVNAPVDFDGDGDLDVLTLGRFPMTTTEYLSWHENTTGMGDFDEHHTLTPLVVGVTSVGACDVDRDGDPDLLCASRWDGKISWFENIGGNRPFGLQRIITDDAYGVRSVDWADLDSDGDADALWTTDEYQIIAWHENLDGVGQFDSRRLITTAVSGGAFVTTADFDRDGDPDVLSRSHKDDKVAWYENLNGSNEFGPQQIITDTDNTDSVCVGDLDGDGNTDVILSSSDYGRIMWYANANGDGAFAPRQSVGYVPGVWAVAVGDINGDGSDDVVYATRLPGTVGWFENLSGFGNFGVPRTVDDDTLSALALAISDLDGDGDNDIIATPYAQGAAWYENLDGMGTFGSRRQLTENQATDFPALATDFDGDGRCDIVARSTEFGAISFHRNLGAQFALEATDAATATAHSGGSVVMLEANVIHRGRDGDNDIALESLSLILEENEGDPLTSSEANALIETLQILVDDESDGPGTPVAQLDNLVLDAQGRVTVALDSSDPNVRFGHGESLDFSVAVALRIEAWQATPNQFRVTLNTENDCTAVDVPHGVQLELEPAANVTSTAVTVLYPRDAYEVDDSPSTPSAIASGEVQSRSIYPIGDHDWVRFNLDEAAQVTASVASAETKMVLYLARYEDSIFDLIDFQVGESASVTANLPSGEYFLHAEDWESDEEVPAYTLSLVTSPFTGDIYEIDNSPQSATSIAIGETQPNHSIVPANDHDWAAFTLDEPGIVTARATGAVNAMVLYIFSLDGGFHRYDVANEPRVVAHLPAGTYHIMAEDWGSDQEVADYSLGLEFIAEPLPALSAEVLVEYLLGERIWMPGLDVNGDGRIDAADVVSMTSFASILIP